MLALSDRWAPVLLAQPETGMGYQVATVVLQDGQAFEQVEIVGGIIAKVRGSTEIPFAQAEIDKIVVDHGR